LQAAILKELRMSVELRFMDQTGVVIHERGEFDYERFVLIPSPGDVVHLAGKEWKVVDRIFYYHSHARRESGDPDVIVSFRCETM
jgi:hypothetical protein